MKKKLVFGASAICLSLAFWACGDGAIESLEAEDDIARAFALDDEGLKELVKAAEKDCDADESCKTAQNDAYKSPDSDDDDDDEDEESSDSDSGDSSASSSGSTAGSSTAVAGSSTSTGTSSTATVTSSAGGTSSAQVTPVSSSSGPQITPTSSAAVSSSSVAATGKTTGFCQLSSNTIEKGGSTTWSFFKMSGSKDETYKWTFPDGSTSTDAKPSKTYAQAGEYSAKVLVNAGMESENEIDCSVPPTGAAAILKVNGTKISGCTCEFSNNTVATLDLADDNPAIANWAVSGCTNGDGSTEFTYKWGDGVDSETAEGVAVFTERTKKFTPSVTITNADGMSMKATCPTVDVTDSDNPEYVMELTNTGNNSTPGSQALVPDVPYVVEDVGSCSNVRFNCTSQSSGCSISVNGGTPTSGGPNSWNNILSTKPSKGDVLVLTGEVGGLWCSGW